MLKRCAQNGEKLGKYSKAVCITCYKNACEAVDAYEKDRDELKAKLKQIEEKLAVDGATIDEILAYGATVCKAGAFCVGYGIMKEKLDKAVQELVVVKKERDELNERLSVLRIALRDVEGNCVALNKKREELESKLRGWEKDGARLMEERDAAREQVKERDARITDCVSELKRREGEINFAERIMTHML